MACGTGACGQGTKQSVVEGLGMVRVWEGCARVWKVYGNTMTVFRLLRSG
jgi:hypothetical protein